MKRQFTSIMPAPCWRRSKGASDAVYLSPLQRELGPPQGAPAALSAVLAAADQAQEGDGMTEILMTPRDWVYAILISLGALAFWSYVIVVTMRAFE